MSKETIEEYFAEGTQRVQYSVHPSGFAFPSRETAELWADAEWPRKHPITGEWHTSDRRSFPNHDKGKAMAEARQQHLNKKGADRG